jgi:hypothetical protein
MALHYDSDRRIDGFFWFDRFTDVLFMADLVFNFFTGYVTHEGAVIMDYSVIIRVSWTNTLTHKTTFSQGSRIHTTVDSKSTTTYVITISVPGGSGTYVGGSRWTLFRPSPSN